MSCKGLASTGNPPPARLQPIRLDQRRHGRELTNQKKVSKLATDDTERATHGRRHKGHEGQAFGEVAEAGVNARRVERQVGRGRLVGTPLSTMEPPATCGSLDFNFTQLKANAAKDSVVQRQWAHRTCLTDPRGQCCPPRWAVQTRSLTSTASSPPRAGTEPGGRHKDIREASKESKGDWVHPKSPALTGSKAWADLSLSPQ
jgi:hypothetical protein